MPSTRRRFLTGVTALAGAIAGCNESTTRAVDETVTPVEVPRTDREILEEVDAIEVPSIPPAVVVGDGHLQSAIGQLERLRGSLLEAAETRNEPFGDGGFGRGRTPEEIVERVDERIRRARETGPSEEALDILRRVLDDVARPLGYLRAESGELTMADVDVALEAERSAVSDLRGDLEYRVATPVAEHLPTLGAAEETHYRLDDSGARVAPAASDDGAHDREAVSEPEPTPTSDPDPGHVAERYYRLERVRRHRDDVERYLETATDGAAPSLRADLEAELADVRAELEAVAAEYRGEAGPGGGGSLPEELRGMRRSVGGRIDRYLSRTAASPSDGDLVRVLFDGVQRLVTFRSVDVGVERTLERLDGRRFPTAALLEEKRRAVEHVETAAESPALGRRFAETAAESPALRRRFAETAPQLLRTAGGFGPDEAPGVEDVARMHVYYIGGGEWAARGVSRGEAIAAALGSRQS